MLRRCRLLNAVKDGANGGGERGLYFPINHRIIDRRVDPSVAEQMDVQSRYRRELRSGVVTGETRQVKPPHWSAKVRPTHFISLRLPAKCSLHTSLKGFRDAVLFSHPRLEPLLTPPTALHVTLTVMTVPNSTGQLSYVKETMNKVVPSVLSSRLHQRVGTSMTGSGLQLHFSGLGTFQSGRVLFARCAADREFSKLDQLVRELRRTLGKNIDVKGNPHDSYVPHVTVAKVRKTHKSLVGSEALPPSLWCDFQFDDFGDVVFSHVDLCEMKRDPDTGYYVTAHSVPLE